MQTKKLLLFDLDGTLINSVPDLALSINAMLTHLNRETYEETLIDSWIGNGALTLVERALAQEDKANIPSTEETQEALKIFLDFYAQNLCNQTICYPNVAQTLKSLKAKAYTLAIVTNKPHKFVAPILEGFGLDGLFELILGGDSLAEKKPSPAPLLHVCEHLGFDVSQSLMIGDSKNDILAAQACKMDNVAVTYGYNYGEDISVYTPNYIIDDFADLLKYL